MNIKTLLTDEEIEASTTQEELTKHNCRERVIEARASAKTKRVMIGRAEKLIHTYNWFKSYTESILDTPDWEEFKKRALGE